MTRKTEKNTPKKGDLWVHREAKGLDIPAAIVRVHGVENGTVSFSPQGGGFVKSGPVARFVEECRLVGAPDEVKTAHRAIMSFDYGLAVPCYTFGKRWNGWGMPYVVREHAERFAAFIAYDHGGLTNCWWEGDALFIIADVEEYRDCKSRAEALEQGVLYSVEPKALETVDGGQIVYDLGGLGWCWHTDGEGGSFADLAAALDDDTREQLDNSLETIKEANHG